MLEFLATYAIFADYWIDSPEVVPGPSGEVYTFHRSTVQSNLYIPVP